MRADPRPLPWAAITTRLKNKNTPLSDRWVLCGASVAAVGRQRWQSSCCRTSCSYCWNHRRVQAGHSSLSFTLSIHPFIYPTMLFFPSLPLASLVRHFFFLSASSCCFFLFFHILYRLPFTLISFFLSSFTVIPQLPLFFHLCHLLFYWKVWESIRRYKKAPTKCTCLISFRGRSRQHLWFLHKIHLSGIAGVLRLNLIEFELFWVAMGWL